MRPTRAGFALALALALRALAGAPALAAQDPDSLAEPMLVELRLGQAVARTVPGFRMGRELLLPALQFFEMAEVRAAADSAGRLHATLQPGNVPLLVDTRAGIQRKSRSRAGG
jgi:hypothetical protein